MPPGIRVTRHPKVEGAGGGPSGEGSGDAPSAGRLDGLTMRTSAQVAGGAAAQREPRRHMLDQSAPFEASPLGDDAGSPRPRRGTILHRTGPVRAAIVASHEEPNRPRTPRGSELPAWWRRSVDTCSARFRGRGITRRRPGQDGPGMDGYGPGVGGHVTARIVPRLALATQMALDERGAGRSAGVYPSGQAPTSTR